MQIKISFFLLFISTCLPVLRVESAEFPLHDMAVIAATDLSGKWRFKADPDNRGIDERWYEATTEIKNWIEVSVPGIWDKPAGDLSQSVFQTDLRFGREAWNKPPGEIGQPVYQGKGWFARVIEIPEEWTGTREIAFLGAMHIADLWVNGLYLGVHRGGYTPFFFDLTDVTEPGTTALVVVRVDNQLSQQTIPTDRLGWQNYGGLYREPYLLHRPRVRIENLASSFAVAADESATAYFTGELCNKSGESFSGTVQITMKAGNEVIGEMQKQVAVEPGQNFPLTFELAIAEPRLWSPDDPFLHDLLLSWGDADNSRQGDSGSIEFRVGIRELRIEDELILLNNQPLWMQGFGQHEMAPGYGPCLPPEILRRDLELMRRQYQANSFRTGHYTYHPRFYHLADQLGLIVFTEIPAWQVKSSILQSDISWERWLEPQLRAMVRTFRNHASVFFWGVANETSKVDHYYQRATEYVRQIDPTRPVTAVIASARDLHAAKWFDLSARNLHYGWYHSREVYALRDYLPRLLEAAQGKPLWVAEVGGHAMIGRFSGGYGDHSRGSETYLDRLLRFAIQYNATESEQVAGVSVWTWSDFYRSNRTEAHGILDGERQPKLAAYAVRNLFAGDLRAFIIEKQNLCEPGEYWQGEIRLFNPRRLADRQLQARWVVLRGNDRLQEGKLDFSSTGQRADRVGSVDWSVPDDADPGLYEFWIELEDRDGNWLHTNSSLFDVGTASRPGFLNLTAMRNGVESEDAWVERAGVRIPVYPFPGLLIALPAGNHDLVVRDREGGLVKKQVAIESGRQQAVEIAFED